MKNRFFFALALFPVMPMFSAQGENIALHKKVVLHTVPNYFLSQDDGDVVQLTDGVRVSPSVPMWAEAGSVTWQREPVVLITIDLKAPQSLGVITFSTGARRASSVSWPSHLTLYLSQDGEQWQEVGDIVEMERLRGSSPAQPEGEAYVSHLFQSEPLNLKARYVSIAAKGTPYLSVDEILISSGFADAREIQPVIKGIEGIRTAFNEASFQRIVRKRMDIDRKALGRQITKSALTAEEKKKLQREMESISPDALVEAELGPGYRGIFPLSNEHRRIFAVQAALWRCEGIEKPFFQVIHRFDWVPLFRSLKMERFTAAPTLKFRQLGKEKRATLLLISNPTPDAITFEVGIEGRDHLKESLHLYESHWTDTIDFTAVSDVLLPVQSGEITVPSGMTRKVWVSLDSARLEEGKHEGALVFSHRDERYRVPIEARVSPIILNKAKLALGAWDYLLGKKAYGITPENFEAAAAFVRRENVNVAWVPRSLVPWPGEEDFDGNNLPLRPFDFSLLTERIRQYWPDADHYMIFLQDGQRFAGAALGAPGFTPRLAAWLKQLEQAFEGAGIPFRKVALLTVDEPLDAAKAQLSLQWTEAIRETGSGVRIFTDPIWKDFKTLPKEYVKAADIVSPNIQYMKAEGASAFAYFEKLRREGKELWFYICSGPVRTVDPVGYYRLTPWFVFHHRGSGLGFWSLADTGGAVSSWQEHTGVNTAYSPLFLGRDSVDTSIHWEALQEGRLDFACFQMLETAAKEHSAFAEPVRKLLSEVAQQLARIPDHNGGGALIRGGLWKDAASGETIEQLRIRAIDLLEAMEEKAE